MNFPDELIFRFFYWLVNTPGVGSVFVGFVGVACITGATAALRWIVQGAKVDEEETYA